ncbi:MAG: type II secretion system inner membrane protein GspF [Candidatus Omnitrophica bacterium]|nr:type II secretion system inner membrane protein GspF [Candidatus Omnitrophota bacterium]
MPRFFYKAKKGPQEIVEGRIDAETKAQALSKITGLGLFPVNIEEEGETAAGIRSSLSFTFSGRVKTADLALFTRQLADLLEGGVTIIDALSVLARQTENKKLKNTIEDISSYVKAGNNLAAALAQHPSIFPHLYVSMVRSGEVSGALEVVLNRLSGFLEEQEEFKTKVQAALAYPILMACVGVATIIVLLTFVMPRVVGIFQDLGQGLPFITQVLLAISDFIRFYWYLLIAGFLFIFFAVRQLYRTPEGKAFLDRAKLRLPVLGDFLRKVDIARFARTLGTLLANGVTILESLEVSRDIMSNAPAKKEITEAFNSVREGSTLAKAFSEGEYFPLFVTNMIAVGEESGQLEKALMKIADSYERQTDKTIKIISSLIEPAMILVMGLIVGFIVISILLPIFQISLIAR